MQLRFKFSDGNWFAKYNGETGTTLWEYTAFLDDGPQEVIPIFYFNADGTLNHYFFRCPYDSIAIVGDADGMVSATYDLATNVEVKWTRGGEWLKYDYNKGTNPVGKAYDMSKFPHLTYLRPLFGPSPFLEWNMVTTLPADLTVIEAEAFAGSNLQVVVISKGVTTIGSRAFAGCKNLVEINIPASVTYIAEDAFVNTALDSIIAPYGSYAATWAEEHGLIVE